MVEGELHHPTHTRHLDAPFDQVAGRDSQIKIDTHLALVRFNEKVRLWLFADSNGTRVCTQLGDSLLSSDVIQDILGKGGLGCRTIIG